MYWIEYIGLALTVLGLFLTLMNVLIANLSAVFPVLVTKALDLAYSYPDNTLGPKFFSGGSEYLDLEIMNAGPGTARDIKWRIDGTDTSGSDSNTVPFIGHNGQVNVRGFIGKEHMVDKINAVKFTVKITHGHLFPWFYTSKTFIFDGEGKLISYHRGIST
ncbi:MAG: hypothetical protein M1556_01375 [Candidatus Thermoplasmatota archaeon]|jgi:hypothetical protein|nr:hypothetical protein [Candidatus Thermoplasmatota archaeon]MCL6002286.1 hypothetical protein [Candidatus Thermoplasmatota archaeon]